MHEGGPTSLPIAVVTYQKKCFLDILPAEIRAHIWSHVLGEVSVRVERKDVCPGAADVPLHGAFRRDPRYTPYRRRLVTKTNCWPDKIEDAFLRGISILLWQSNY